MKIQTDRQQLAAFAAMLNSSPVTGVAQMRLANKTFEQLGLDDVQANVVASNARSLLDVVAEPMGIEIDESVRRFVLDTIEKTSVPSASIARIIFKLVIALGE